MQNELLNYLVPNTADRDSDFSEPSPRTILLVDDDSDIRSLTRTFLKHEGYHVLSCGDAERARQIFCNATANSAGIDLLITDFYMPTQSGMDLAFEFKALRSELPVLLISGGFLSKEQLARLRAEGWSFLGKPFSLTDLLGTVHNILGSSKTVT